MEEINFFLKRIWGFVSQTSAAVRSNMRAASCFDLLWSRRHPWLSRPSQDGSLWWRFVTAAAAAAARQDVLDAKAGGAYPLLAYVFCKKASIRLALSGAPAQPRKRSCKREALTKLNFGILIALLAKVGAACRCFRCVEPIACALECPRPACSKNEADR